MVRRRARRKKLESVFADKAQPVDGVVAKEVKPVIKAEPAVMKSPGDVLASQKAAQKRRELAEATIRKTLSPEELNTVYRAAIMFGISQDAVLSLALAKFRQTLLKFQAKRMKK